MACAEFGAAFYLSGFSNNQDTFSSGSSLRRAGDPAGLDEAQRKRQNGAINKHPLPATVNSYATERTVDKSFQFKNSRKANLFSLYVLKNPELPVLLQNQPIGGCVPHRRGELCYRQQRSGHMRGP
ncbi:hypothetical protein AOLI_G00119390 [Acnodon oligacanthus]